MVDAKSFSSRQLDMMCARPSQADLEIATQTYGFCDEQGVFHEFYGEEGKRTLLAMKALEEKICAKVGRALATMRHDIDAKLESVEQCNLKTVAQSAPQVVHEKFQDLSDQVLQLSLEAFESRSDLLAQME